MRTCTKCGGELAQAGGWEQSAAERAGSALEVDEFVCGGCGVQYKHRVDERFSGDIHIWWSRASADGDWKLLDKSQWPTFTAKAPVRARETLLEKQWTYRLERDGERLLLTVVCGGVAIFELTVALDDDESRRFREEGEAFIDALASKICYSPTSYRERHVDD